jgi:transcriptional regulator with XRE-family HTH domain
MLQGRANHRRRIRRAAERRERLRNVQEMLRLLRDRGLTKSEICRLGGFTMTSLLRWETAKVPSKRGISPNVEKRLGILVSAAIGVLPLPKQTDILNYRRRLPHPDLPLLEAMCRDELERLRGQLDLFTVPEGGAA